MAATHVLVCHLCDEWVVSIFLHEFLDLNNRLLQGIGVGGWVCR